MIRMAHLQREKDTTNRPQQRNRGLELEQPAPSWYI